MDIAIAILITFLAGVGLGSHVVGASVRGIIAAAKAELTALSTKARQDITEAENAIRRVPSDIVKEARKVLP